MLYGCALFVNSGFIDFIVDPSFQVMGDMLERILTVINEQKLEQPLTSDGDIRQEVVKVHRDSLSSSSSSIHSSPKPAKGESNNLTINQSLNPSIRSSVYIVCLSINHSSTNITSKWTGVNSV